MSGIFWSRHCDNTSWFGGVCALNATYIDLSPCVQNSYLTCIPCLLLWLLTPFYAITLAKRPVYHSWTSCSKLNACKLTAAIALTLIDLFCMISKFRYYGENRILSADNVSSVLLVVTFAMTVVYIQWIFRKGLHTSAVLFVFWVLLLVATIIEAISHAAIEHGSVFSLLYIKLGLIALEFVLSCIGDRKAQIPDAMFDNEKTLLLSRAVEYSPREKAKACPKESASILSQTLFTWLIPKFLHGLSRQHKVSDICRIMENYSAEVNYSKFSKIWNKELTKQSSDTEPGRIGKILTGIKQRLARRRRVSLTRALVRAYLPYFMLDFVFMMGFVAANFSGPILLRSLIHFLQDQDQNVARGYITAISLCFVTVATNLCLEHHFDVSGITTVKIRSALVSTIYRKCLLFSNAGPGEISVGYIVNMVSVDVNKLQETLDFFSFIWVTPLMVIVSMVLLWQQIGISCLFGLLFLLILLPANSVLLARKLKNAQKKMMMLKERRLKLTSQVLSGIKVLKLYAWEPHFERSLKELRGQELTQLRKVNLLKTLTYSSWLASPLVMILVCFIAYILSSEDHVLDAEKTFVSIAVSNALYFPLSAFSQVISCTVQGLVSLGRIRKFLLQEELEKPPRQGWDAFHSIVVQDGTFTWDTSVCLNDINIKIKPGSLVAVVGKVGCGKSSLLSAILGEMNTLSGSICKQGSVAYVPQQAWIQNLTLRDNVLFSSAMNMDKYVEVLDACAMRPDLYIIPGGDMAEIGEKGLNLSGGQKQRVSLARAVYSDREIYLLDDPLSAVDAHVGKHIFEQVIGPGGILKNKTRLFVTHGISHLPFVDSIIFMKDGCIVETGTYQELCNNETFAEFLRICMTTPDGDNTDDVEGQIKAKDDDGTQALSKRKVKPEGTTKKEQDVTQQMQLIAEEDASFGQIDCSVIVYLIKAAGCLFPSLLLASAVLYTSVQCLTQLWLREWSQDHPATANDTLNEDKTRLRLAVFGGLTAFQLMSICGISIAIAFGGMNASFNLHSKLLHCIIRSPMSFFDTTPAGRILNRFSRDMDAVDQKITFSSQLFLIGTLQLVSTVFIVLYTFPICAAILAPLVLLLVVLERIYLATACQLQRIDSICRSPLYAFLEETVLGISSIRAFGCQHMFIERMEKLLNRSQSAWFDTLEASRCFCVVMQLLGNVIPTSTILFGIAYRNDIDASSLGMAVSFTLQVGSMMAMCVRNMCELEIQTVNVERIKEYSELESEAPWNNPDKKPRRNWPEEGVVEFKNYQTRYRHGLALVLKGISCVIHSGEKVGIVGRTGAGKSSFALALFRMIEASNGAIYIDGIDISKIGLHDVRGRMSIIPQDPVMFSETIRFNLDPSGRHSENEIWGALEHSHLKGLVESLPDGLQHMCDEGGGNLSVGQRQLVCLARALLRKSKILILDEATASVDMKTDDLIQSTIRSQFKHCTVITVAHRLNTIMDYDRIIVMEDGRIEELDSPDNLTADTSSVFYALAKEAQIL